MATVQTTDAGITEINEIENNVQIHNLARFAVDEHNKIQNAGLEFVKVNDARKQDVAGTIYYITLEAKIVDTDTDTTTQFETQVLVKESLNSMELLQFTPVPIIASCYCGPPPNAAQSLLSST